MNHIFAKYLFVEVVVKMALVEAGQTKCRKSIDRDKYLTPE